MANTLSNLIPDLYESLDVVSRELVGFIPAVTMDAQAARAAVGEVIRVPITPVSAAEDVTPGQLPPDDGDQTIGNTQIVITKSRAVPFRWTGEEQRGLANGPGYAAIRQDQMRQAMRTLCNEVEAFVGGVAIAGASRAVGTAGTTPFGTTPNIGDAADVRKVLDDNGCPMGDRHLVINTAAGANLRKLTQLTKALEAGTTDMRAQGVLLDLFGFDLRESAGVQKHGTVGTGASYVVNGATAAGSTVITLKTGTGTVLAGDAVTIGGLNYVVTVGTSAAGPITIAAPGLQAAAADGATVAIVAAFTGNMAFHRSSLVLVTRAPALPEEGDMASDRTTITDPRSGLSFEVAMYPQYRRIRYEISLAYGSALIKSNHAAILLG